MMVVSLLSCLSYLFYVHVNTEYVCKYVIGRFYSQLHDLFVEPTRHESLCESMCLFILLLDAIRNVNNYHDLLLTFSLFLARKTKEAFLVVLFDYYNYCTELFFFKHHFSVLNFKICVSFTKCHFNKISTFSVF